MSFLYVNFLSMVIIPGWLLSLSINLTVRLC